MAATHSHSPCRARRVVSQAQLRHELIGQGLTALMVDEVSMAASRTSADDNSGAATVACALALGILIEMGAVDELLDKRGVVPLVSLARSGKVGALEALQALDALASSEVRLCAVVELVLAPAAALAAAAALVAPSAVAEVTCRS